MDRENCAVGSSTRRLDRSAHTTLNPSERRGRDSRDSRCGRRHDVLSRHATREHGVCASLCGGEADEVPRHSRGSAAAHCQCECALRTTGVRQLPRRTRNRIRRPRDVTARSVTNHELNPRPRDIIGETNRHERQRRLDIQVHGGRRHRRDSWGRHRESSACADSSIRTGLRICVANDVIATARHRRSDRHRDCCRNRTYVCELVSGATRDGGRGTARGRVGDDVNPRPRQIVSEANSDESKHGCNILVNCNWCHARHRWRVDNECSCRRFQCGIRPSF